MLTDFHTHFFSWMFFHTLANQSPGEESSDEKLARVSAKTGVEVPPNDTAAHVARWIDQMDAHGVDHMVSFASVPTEIPVLAEFETLEIPEDERGPFLADLGIKVPARLRFMGNLFAQLHIATFFTVGEDEVRAWTVPEGTPAAKAAGKIHTDLERGFIRAEVISGDECIALGGLNEAKKAGKLRIEGKDYIVQDGEIFHVRFNV